MLDVFICMLFTAVVAILSFAFGFAVAVAAMRHRDESR